MYVWRVRPRDWPHVLRAWCTACTFAYGVTFFFGKQAFLNYYEFLLIIPVLWLTLEVGRRDEVRGARDRPGAPLDQVRG